MKTIIAKIIPCAMLIISFTIYADKILLTGRPIILLPDSDHYIFPNSYVPTHLYHFVDLSGDTRICFINSQAQLNRLDLLRINIMQNGKKYLWYCYRYDSRYFTLDF